MGTLPPRLAVVARQVLPGYAMADIGSDHALLASYLLDNGICPRAIVTDVGIHPLERARKAMAEYSHTQVEFRLGYGLSVIEPEEVASVVIAGMGGRTIADILASDLRKLTGFRRLILQPMDRFPVLFAFLAQHGFRPSGEDVVWDNGKMFLVVTVDTEKGEPYHLSPAERELGPCLLKHCSEGPGRDFVHDWITRTRTTLRRLARSETAAAKAKTEYLTAALREVEEVWQ